MSLLLERVNELEMMSSDELESLLQSTMTETLETAITALDSDDDLEPIVSPTVELTLELCAGNRDLLMISIVTLEFKVGTSHGEMCLEAFQTKIEALDLGI